MMRTGPRKPLLLPNIQLVVNDSSPFAEDDTAEVIEDTSAGWQSVR